MGKNDFDEIAEGLLGDRNIDDDSKLNMNDCRPFDPEHQDIKGVFSTLASKVKSGATSVKQKYRDLQTKRKVKQEKEKREAEQERQKKLAEMEKEKQKLERKRKLAKQKKQLEQEKSKLKEAQPKGTLEKIGDFLSSAGAKKRGSRARQGKVDNEDKWAVVEYSDHSVAATFQYKTDAKDYSSGKDDYGVMKTKTALKRGYQITGRGAYDVFGASGSEPEDMSSFLLGSQGENREERQPWYEQGLV